VKDLNGTRTAVQFPVRRRRRMRFALAAALMLASGLAAWLVKLPALP
jgi:hypothetical protein